MCLPCRPKLKNSKLKIQLKKITATTTKDLNIRDKWCNDKSSVTTDRRSKPHVVRARLHLAYMLCLCWNKCDSDMQSEWHGHRSTHCWCLFVDIVEGTWSSQAVIPNQWWSPKLRKCGCTTNGRWAINHWGRFKTNFQPFHTGELVVPISCHSLNKHSFSIIII